MQLIRIALQEDEREALQNLAQDERRDMRAQAALLIRESLEKRGLLEVRATARQTSGVKNADG
jgi:hypothetical protein